MNGITRGEPSLVHILLKVLLKANGILLLPELPLVTKLGKDQFLKLLRLSLLTVRSSAGFPGYSIQ